MDDDDGREVDLVKALAWLAWLAWLAEGVAGVAGAAAAGPNKNGNVNCLPVSVDISNGELL
jgi:hypothetical protein